MSLKKTLTRIVFVGALALGGCNDHLSGPSLNVVFGDLNNDGKKDIITCKYNSSGWGSNEIYTSISTKNGHTPDKLAFVLKPRALGMNVTETPKKLYVEDYDGDGNNDFLFTRYNPQGFGSWGLYLSKGNGDGTLDAPKKIKDI